MKDLSPTFSNIVVFFYHKGTTRNYYLMDLSCPAIRGAQIWHIWKQHYLIEWFWKVLKSTFKIKEMRLHKEGVYTDLVIKVLAYLFTIRLKGKQEFSNSSITQMIRKIKREMDLETVLLEHFHLTFLITQAKLTK